MNQNKRSAIAGVRFGGKASESNEPMRRGSKITAGVPLARLIKRKLTDAPELVMQNQPRSVAAERFRRLKNVLMNDPDGAPQVIVVTSAAPGEGKSVTAMNLALAFAADRQGEVLLLDADMRRPTVEQWLQPTPKLGLSELLAGKTELDHALLTLDNSPLRIVPAGTPARDPVELLAGEFMPALIATLRARFLRIIIDTPPIVPFTDADTVGAHSDGLLIIARAGETRQAMVRQAIAAVTSTRVLGAILNDVTYTLADREHHYSTRKYYEYYEKRHRE